MNSTNLQIIDTIIEKKSTINCGGKIIDLSEPKVMGILNITPDSFFDGGKNFNIFDVKNNINNMINAGVDIIDIGAISSRPGADIISVEEEKTRLFPVLELLKNEFAELIVSVDTFRAEIAEESVSKYGVSIINDISAGELDNDMFATIAKLNVPYIIMHMPGNPKNMQLNTKYKNLEDNIFEYFQKKHEELKLLGVHDIIIDLGFGFGKTLDQNYFLLKKLDNFKIFNLPILVGVSRKSMIHKLLDISPNESLNGTNVVNTIALMNGANIIRVHDVQEANEAIEIYNKYKSIKK